MIEKLIEELGDYDLYEYRPLSEWAELTVLKRLEWTANRMSTLGKLGFLHINYDTVLRANTTTLEALLIALKIRINAIEAQAKLGIDVKGLADEIKRL